MFKSLDSLSVAYCAIVVCTFSKRKLRVLAVTRNIAISSIGSNPKSAMFFIFLMLSFLLFNQKLSLSEVNRTKLTNFDSLSGIEKDSY